MLFKNIGHYTLAYDELKNLYTAEFSDPISGSTVLYEIDKDVFENFEDNVDSINYLTDNSRKLYMYHNDQYGSPYIVVFDENYEELCPWALVPKPEPEDSWPKEMTDAVTEALEIKKKN